MEVRRIGVSVLVGLLLAAGLAGVAQAEPTPTFDPSTNPFAADGSLLGDWGIGLSNHTPGGSNYGFGHWEPDDLNPDSLPSDRYQKVVEDDDVAYNQGGEAFDTEALFFAYDADFFYFAMVTSIPPDGGRDPYSSPETRVYGDTTQRWAGDNRRRFYPGDIALSCDGSAVENFGSDAGDGYEYGIVIAPPNPRKSRYAGKVPGEVWHEDPQLDWDLADDRNVWDSFSNFVPSGSELVNPDLAVGDSGPQYQSYKEYDQTVNGSMPFGTYNDILYSLSWTDGNGQEVSFYYGAAKDPLPDGSMEASSDGTYGNLYTWGYGSTSSGVPINTYVYEGKFSRSLFGAPNDPNGTNYDVHWTMGCANDVIGLHATISPIPTGNGGVIPEPFSAAFAATAFGIVVGARLRRRRKRQGR